MSRMVKHDQHGPAQVGDKWVCQCGLSSNKPFCDGSHKTTLDEKKDKVYCYDKDKKRKECKNCC